MPWHIVKGGGTCAPSEWAVIKNSDGSTAGCHPSEAAAAKQVAALYANEPGAGRMDEHRASVDNSAWDGNAALAACSAAACYRATRAGRKTRPAGGGGAWARPPHKRPGAPPHAAGVRNALSRLPQTQGLTNREAARSHLEAHMRVIQAQAGRSNEEAGMAAPERRYTMVPVELRARGDRPKIGGYAIVWNRLSQNLGGWVERTDPAATNKSRGDGWPDVLARYNHD